MRAFLVIALLIAGMAVIGWIRFSSPAGNPTLEVDKAKITDDTREVVDTVRNAAERVESQLETGPVVDPDPEDGVSDGDQSPLYDREQRPVVITE